MAAFSLYRQTFVKGTELEPRSQPSARQPRLPERRGLWYGPRSRGGWGTVVRPKDGSSHGAEAGVAAEGRGSGPSRGADQPGASAGAAGAPVGDVLPAGGAGGGPAGAVRAEELGPDPSGALVGDPRAGG